MRAFSTALAIISTMAFATFASAQTIGPGGTGNGGLYQLGAGGSTSYGQTLVSPGGTLSAFTFDVISFSQAGDVVFGFAPLTGNVAGTPLFTSQPFLLATGTNSISGISVPTILNQSYIGYLTVSQVPNAVRGGFISTYNNNPYTDGFAGVSNAANPTGSAFSNFGRDFAFTATFVPAIPEPATWGLMIVGFGAVGATLRRKRRVTLEHLAAR